MSMHVIIIEFYNFSLFLKKIQIFEIFWKMNKKSMEIHKFPQIFIFKGLVRNEQINKIKLGNTYAYIIKICI